MSSSFQLVHVTFDADTNKLNVDMDPLALEPDSAVSWVFGDIPEALGTVIPSIQFQSGDVPPDATLGPFQCLQTQTVPAGIQGLGNVGPYGTTTYTYTLRLLNLEGAVATSDTHTVTNTQAANTSPECAIAITVDADGQPSFAEPAPLLLLKGDTAIWHISGLQPQQTVSFVFDSFDNPLSGPFESIAMYRGLSIDDSEQPTMRVLGIQFDGGGPGQITYSVAIRDATGEVVFSQEPIIDNLGQPPGLLPGNPIVPVHPPYHGKKA